MKTRRGSAAAGAARTIASQCLAMRARRLQRTVTRVYDTALRPHGLSAAQLGLLAAIALAPGIQSKHLCAMLDLEKSTLSRNVALMVANGWIDARRAGRAQTLGLTPQGAAKLTSALPEWQRAQRSTQRLLSTGDVAILRRAWGPARLE